MRSAVAALALGLTLTAAGLSSCATPDDPVQPPEPDPSITPVYASEEEALAAAEELYGRYLDIANKIGQGGWKDTAGYDGVVRGPALEDELKSATEHASHHLRQVGDIRFDSMTLQQLRDHGTGTVFMTVYVCADVSEVDVVDSAGKSVVSVDRPDRQPLEVDLDDAESTLKLTRSDVWSGTDFC